MIHVVAIITAKPGQRDAALQVFHANVPAVRAEAGCVEYQPVVDATPAAGIQTPLGPDVFVVVEKWETRDALAAHGTAPHMLAYRQAIKDMLASTVVHVLTEA